MTKLVGEVDENISRIELEHGVSSGIRLGSLAPDMVPLFDEHSARMASNKDMKEWYGMDRMERAMLVAVWRIDRSIKNHQAEAEIAQARRNAKRGK